MFWKSPQPLVMDLNADLGEGGTQDEVVIRQITSASIACGGHAGDTSTMRESLRLCAVYRVAAGAHPSFPDRVNFGTQPLDLAAEEITVVIREQLEHLKSVAREVGVDLRHVKLHGLLYYLATADPVIAQAAVRAVTAAGFERIYVTASGRCALRREAKAAGLSVIPEGLADRGYAADGTILLYDHPQSFLPFDQALQQGKAIALQGFATAATGEKVRIEAQSIGLQGNLPDAVALAQELGSVMRQAGIRLAEA